MQKERLGYPITIYVSAKKKQWFIEPPSLVKAKFKKKHKYGFCIYGIDIDKDKDKLVKTIKEITQLILAEKGKK